MSSEPTTPTAIRLLDLTNRYGGQGSMRDYLAISPEFMREQLIEVEAEAVAAYRADLEAKVRALPDYIDREWLDANHPLEYDTGERVSEREQAAWASLTNGKSATRFARCPQCEEWSPCRVRTLFEHDAAVLRLLTDGAEPPKGTTK